MECQNAHWTTKLSKTTWWKPVKLLVAAQLLKTESCGCAGTDVGS